MLLVALNLIGALPRAQRHPNADLARAARSPARNHAAGYHERNVPGVYVSYPFCAQKCTYCNFASGVFPRDLEPRYLSALEREIRGHRWEWLPQTLYLGGGTPGNIAPSGIRALLDAIPG